MKKLWLLLLLLVPGPTLGQEVVNPATQSLEWDWSQGDGPATEGFIVAVNGEDKVQVAATARSVRLSELDLQVGVSTLSVKAFAGDDTAESQGLGVTVQGPLQPPRELRVEIIEASGTMRLRILD